MITNDMWFVGQPVDSIDEKGLYHVAEGPLLGGRYESIHPVAYRLALSKSGGVMHLQGLFRWVQGSNSGEEWRNIPVVEIP